MLVLVVGAGCELGYCASVVTVLLLLLVVVRDGGYVCRDFRGQGSALEMVPQKHIVREEDLEKRREG